MDGSFRVPATCGPFRSSLTGLVGLDCRWLLPRRTSIGWPFGLQSAARRPQIRPRSRSVKIPRYDRALRSARIECQQARTPVRVPGQSDGARPPANPFVGNGLWRVARTTPGTHFAPCDLAGFLDRASKGIPVSPRADPSKSRAWNAFLRRWNRDPGQPPPSLEPGHRPAVIFAPPERHSGNRSNPQPDAW